MSATLKVIDRTTVPEPSRSTATPGASTGIETSLPTQTVSVSWVFVTTTTSVEGASSTITMTTPPALSVSSEFRASTLSPTRSVVTTEAVAPTSENDSDYFQKVAVTVGIWFFVAATGVGAILGIISCIVFAKHRRRDGPWVLMF